jgi:hypothetical protein
MFSDTFFLSRLFLAASRFWASRRNVYDMKITGAINKEFCG